MLRYHSSMNEAMQRELRQIARDVAVKHKISARVQERLEAFAFALYGKGSNVSEVANLLNLAAELFELKTLVVRY